MATATASVSQLVERWSTWSRHPGLLVQFPAGGLGVAFFATGLGWVLKCTVYISFWHSKFTLKNLSVDNECKCQILSLIYSSYTSPAWLPLYVHYIYIYIYRACTQAQSNSFCSFVGRALVYRDPGSQVQFAARGLGVAFFATGPSLLGLKMYIFPTLKFTFTLP